MEITTANGTRCYIFTTACKDISREEKIRRERGMLMAHLLGMEEAALADPRDTQK